jgi:hypothetical protein
VGASAPDHFAAVTLGLVFAGVGYFAAPIGMWFLADWRKWEMTTQPWGSYACIGIVLFGSLGAVIGWRRSRSRAQTIAG